MKKLAISVILCLSSVHGYSQCKTERVSAHKELQTATAVVVGTVTGAQPVPEAWDFLDGVNYTIHVDSKIHGRVRETEMTVFSENSPRFFPMYVGQQYVLYLQPQYGRNEVDNCGNSHQTSSTLSASSNPHKLSTARGF